jgi:hypothetical protein
MHDRSDPSRLGLEVSRMQARRHFLGTCVTGLGAMFLGSMQADGAAAIGSSSQLSFARDPQFPLAPLPPQFPAKAKRVIYLNMAGAPSQLELFEYKPELKKFDGQICPASFVEGKRFAFISGRPRLLGPLFPFHQAGESGAWMSDRLPHFERHVDDVCFIKSMHTDQFNHAPAQLVAQTGNAQLGYASLGSWVTYGLGTENQNLPGFIVLLSGGEVSFAGKQLWGAGFLPGVYQGIECRSHGEPVLYLQNPAEISRPLRRRVLDAIVDINHGTHARYGNPETITRIAQYEMAFRMQLEASDVMDIRKEPEAVRAAYGAVPGQASFANNCLVARRLAEKGVRFIQLYHKGWDSHGNSAEQSLSHGFVSRCRETDQPMAALLADLKTSGLLEDTLLVWGGEFGRTSMREDKSGQNPKYIGRDHNPGAFTIWMAGGGVKHGMAYGETDEMGYEIVKNPVSIRDLHATMLYLLGFDHHKLNYPFQGLDQKITGVKQARVVADIIA